MSEDDQQPALRYLVRIEELTAGQVTCTLLHQIVNHSMDLQQLGSTVTFAATPESFDDLAALSR